MVYHIGGFERDKLNCLAPKLASHALQYLLILSDAEYHIINAE